MYISEATEWYGEVFKYCYDYFTHLRTVEEITLESDELAIEYHLEQLNKAYTLFSAKLYTEIKDITNEAERNAVYYGVKKFLPSIIFENDLINPNTVQEVITEWVGKPGGHYVIKLVKAISDSLKWYDDKDSDKLKQFSNIHNRTYYKKSTSDAPIPESLKILDKEEEYDYLFKRLTEDGFIAKESDFQHFRYVFGGGEYPEDFAPLTWKSTKWALSELLTLLWGKPSVPRPLQENASNLFIKNGEPIGTLSNAKFNFNTDKDKAYSSDYGKLEGIVKEIKTHPS